MGTFGSETLAGLGIVTGGHQMQPSDSESIGRLKSLNAERLKAKLELAWLCVQIIAVFAGGVWAYSVWGVKDAEELRPHVSTDIPSSSLGARWFSRDKKDACMIYGLWSLRNSGTTPIIVEGVQAELLSVEDDSVPPINGQLKDFSMGSLKERANRIGVVRLRQEPDDVNAQGRISRDISVAFNPSTADLKWFDHNRIMIRVIASIRNRKGKDSVTTDDWSSLFYACSDSSPSAPGNKPAVPTVQSR
jgi:hypothetical protein